MERKIISFVAPCYNEEGNVKPFAKMVKETMALTKYDYNIVFVNDGSKDSTYQQLKEIYDDDKSHITVVNFLHNFGKEAALLAGLNEANGDYVCVIDSDMQQHPKYAIEMAEILDNNENVDMVSAKPSNQKDSPILNFFKKSFYSIINKLSYVPFVSGASDFRVFRKNICDAIINLPEHNRFSKGIFSWVCPDFKTIEYEVAERGSGTTKWSFFKLLKYAFEGIFSFSHAPLSFPLIISIIEFFLSIGMYIVAFCTMLFANMTLTTSLFIVGTLLMVSCFNSVSLWFIAQYIAKIHTETINRPKYIIKNILH